MIGFDVKLKPAIMNQTDLGRLSKEQRELVLHQLKNQRHKTFAKDFPLSVDGGNILHNFKVEEGVLNPFIMASRYCAWYMSVNNGLYLNKVAIDIGTGTGILGVTMAINGAAKVILGDISEKAIANASVNVTQYCSKNTEVLRSDLFENISESADCIVFHHPFFADDPFENDSIASSLLADRSLIKRFLTDAQKKLNPSGTIVMPFFVPAGGINDPGYNAVHYGFVTRCRYDVESITGAQLGRIKIYELTRW